MNPISFWKTDFGVIELPPDFPSHIIRKDGWWDMRFKKERLKWQEFIAAETAKLWTT